MEYLEREDEFDTYPDVEQERRRVEREDEEVDVLTMPSKKDGRKEEESFVLPMLYDIDHSDEETGDLIRTGVGKSTQES